MMVLAMDGITGDLASNTTIDHLSMNSMDLNARGVHLTNSFNMSFTGNDISVAGEYGIYCNNCDFSEYLNNEIIGPDNGIHARNSSNSDFVSNEIEVQGDYGIDAYDCDFSRIDSNVVRGYDDGMETAIYAAESYYVNIEHNDLESFRRYGVNFHNSANAKVNHNILEISETPYSTTNNWRDPNAGIYNNASNQFSEVNYNEIDVIDGIGDGRHHGRLGEQHDCRPPLDELGGLERPRCVLDQQLQHELHRERHLCGW